MIGKRIIYTPFCSSSLFVEGIIVDRFRGDATPNPVDYYLVKLNESIKIIEEENDAILFAKWINREGWIMYDEVDRWHCVDTPSSTVVTTKQLYGIYLRSKKPTTL